MKWVDATDEIGALKAELHLASETIRDLTARLEQTQRDMATAGGEHAERMASLRATSNSETKKEYHVKVAHSAVQEEPSQAKEQEEVLQHQLREKEELQALISSPSEDKGVVQSLSTEVEGLRDQVSDDLKYCNTSNMAANIMTKGLSGEQFEKVRFMAGVAPTSEHPDK